MCDPTQKRSYRSTFHTVYRSMNSGICQTFTTKSNNDIFRNKLICKQKRHNLSTNIISIPQHFVTENHLDTKACNLLQQINDNLNWKIDSNAMFYDMLTTKYQHYDKFIFMEKHNLTLTHSEFVAVRFWSLSERLTKYYHIDCAKNKLVPVKWKLFHNQLKNAIIKINKAVIINSKNYNSSNIFPSLPFDLYRGTKVFDPKCKKWALDTILSFTTCLDAAALFAALSKYKEQNEGCILNIEYANNYLLNGQLIAAPINWLSSYDYEQEWVVLPSATFDVDRNNQICISSGCMYRISMQQDISHGILIYWFISMMYPMQH